MSYVGVLVVGLIISMYFSYERRKGFSPDLLILKALSSLAFLLCGFVAISLTFSKSAASLYGPCILFGGVMGLCGDIALDMKGIYEDSKDKYMQCGFISFFIGHIFYNFAIFKENRISIKWIIIAIVISLLIAAGNLALEKVFKLTYGKYKKIVFAYSAILILTTVSSLISLIIGGYSLSRLLMLIGGVFFIVSDMILSNTFFKEGCDGPIWYTTNHITYYIAQFAIMTSICADLLV